jgi:hypothetical protein
LKLLTLKGIQDSASEHIDHGASTQAGTAYAAPDAPIHIRLPVADVDCADNGAENYVASNHVDHFEEDWT